jgi:hypothetical protein
MWLWGLCWRGGFGGCRHHLFRPDPAIRQLYLYTLAVCAHQFGILVHAVQLFLSMPPLLHCRVHGVAVTT